MPSDSPPERARIIKANLMLQAKVGTGTIEDEKIRKMQQTMELAKVDFSPMATNFLTDLAAAVARAQKGEGAPATLIAAMTEPVMQIKANASMFDYQLVGNLANIVLNFLENVEDVDKTMLDIVDAHQKTLSIIIRNKMTGTGGAYGQKIEAELKDACKRYFTKRGVEAFFVE